jgi:alpha-D-ribose 1-methylphosphonate 5-triphosphate diphosphatase
VVPHGVILPSGWESVARIEAGGLLCLPGIVDVHTDCHEHELAPRPGAGFTAHLAMREMDRRLAAAGITTGFCGIAVGPEGGIRSPATADAFLAAGPGLVNTRVHLRFEVTAHDDVPWALDHLAKGDAHLFSLMDHAPGRGRMRDREEFLRFMARTHGMAPEEADSVAARMAAARVHHSADVARLAVGAHAAEVPIVGHDIEDRATLAFYRDIGASVAEFPLTLELASEARRQGMAVVLGAPNLVRGASHAKNLSALEGVAAGVVDILCSDYHPPSMLHAPFRLHREGVLPLAKAWSLVSENPARILGLAAKGAIAAGMDADLILVRVDGEGEPTVVRTYVGGREVVRFGDEGTNLPTWLTLSDSGPSRAAQKLHDSVIDW